MTATKCVRCRKTCRSAGLCSPCREGLHSGAPAASTPLDRRAPRRAGAWASKEGRHLLAEAYAKTLRAWLDGRAKPSYWDPNPSGWEVE